MQGLDQRNAVKAHLERLGGLSPEILRQMLGECIEDHRHSAQCDMHSKLTLHLLDWLEWGPIWMRVDCPHCIRFALPDGNEQMAWWQIPWPGELAQLFFSP